LAEAGLAEAGLAEAGLADADGDGLLVKDECPDDSELPGDDEHAASAKARPTVPAKRCLLPT